jgi:iron(III) transport system permease protein
MNYSIEWRLLANSLLVATAATLLSVLLGFAFALLTVAVPRLARRLLLAAAVLTLALPSFLVTNCWIDLLGATGLLRTVLPLNIFSTAGAVWVLALLFWPIPALAIWSTWQSLEPIHFEIDPLLRGAKLLKVLLCPLAKSLALTSAAVVFALALGNFAVPALLQVKVFPAQAWIEFNTHLNPIRTLELSWPLILAPLLLLVWVRQPRFPWPRETSAEFNQPLRRQLGRPWLIVSAVLGGIAVLFGTVAPVLQLMVSPRTWSEFTPAVIAATPALVNSLVYAVSAAALAGLVGLLLARVPGMDWLWLWFLVPGILLGIGAASYLQSPQFHWFSRTALIVIALLSVRYLALARSITRTGWLSLDRLLVDSARVEGAGGLVLFRRTVWPQLAPQAGTAVYLVYLLALWDVETILLVMPPGGETLASRVFGLLHYGHNAHVNALCLLLLIAAVAPLALALAWRAWANRRPEPLVAEEGG